MVRERDISETLIGGAVFLLPLACWPDLDRPFSTPKIALLICLDLLLAARWLLCKPRSAGPQAGEWLAMGWIAAVSVSALAGASVSFAALLLALLPVPLFFGTGGKGLPDRLAGAIWLGSVAEATIVVLQFCGLDPLRWLGWQPEAFASPRMRVYGTMGNPDFVAAWCCATLPFAWREIDRHRSLAVAARKPWPKGPVLAALALQIAAVLATGSRVFALVLPLQAGLLAFRWKRGRRAWLLALPAAALVLYFAPSRPLAATIQGRLYLAQIAAGHWRETPVAGHGPGGFEGRFAQWQAEWLSAHRRDPGAGRFAGEVDHAHNDYLEFLVEYGPAGLAVFLGLCGWVTVQAWRGRARPMTSAEASAIGAISLLAIAVVDFPFHRPAEWGLFWLFAGILKARQHTSTQGA